MLALEVSARPLRSHVVVIARQHPGETVGSFVAEGFLQWLCSGAPEARELLRVVNVIVIPMVNVDGVVAGNFRASVTGTDLNRQWTDPQLPYRHDLLKIKEYLATKKNI